MAITQATGTQIKDGSLGVVDLSATGTPSASTFLRGDNTWAIPSGGDLSNYVTLNTAQTITGAKTFDANVTMVGKASINNPTTPDFTKHGLVVRSASNVADEGLEIRALNESVQLKIGYGKIIGSSALTIETNNTLRLGTTTSDSVIIQIAATPKFTIGSTGNATVANLGTGLTAPTTTGTTKMVVTDANGLLSFADIPGGGSSFTSLSAIGSTPNANGATATGNVLNLEPASASFGGVVTTGPQTFAGAKTFTSALLVDTLSAGFGATLGSNMLSFTDDGVIYTANIKAPTAASSIDLFIPNRSGTFRIPVSVNNVTADTTGNITIPAGISRSISSIATNTTAGATSSTDYVYFVTGTTTLTLPTAVGNTNRYTIVHKDTNTLTIATTSGQTIAFYPAAPATTATVTAQGTVVELFSDGTNWWTI